MTPGDYIIARCCWSNTLSADNDLQVEVVGIGPFLKDWLRCLEQRKRCVSKEEEVQKIEEDKGRCESGSQGLWRKAGSRENCCEREARGQARQLGEMVG